MVLSGAEVCRERDQRPCRVLEGRGGRGLSDAERLLPHWPLPTHRPYLPGSGTRPQSLSIETLGVTELVAYGVDLFHAGYVWEAHEAWEHAWHQLDDGSELERVLRAFIRMTAAHVKLRQGNERGVASHRRGAQAHLEGLPQTLEFDELRIDVASFQALLAQNSLPRLLPVRRG